MSTTRKTRLVATALTVIGSALTAYCLINPNHGLDDGSLLFPIGALTGVATLISHRPRRAK